MLRFNHILCQAAEFIGVVGFFLAVFVGCWIATP